MRHPEVISPVKVLLLVLGVVFTVEASIMVALSAFEPESWHGTPATLVDSVSLVAVLFPVLWILVVRPLRALVRERGALLARTLKVQEEERARLARDLHDELGQVQTAILLGLQSVSTAENLDQARERAEGVRKMAVVAVDSTRRIARGLAPSVLSDLGLGPAVERVCEDIAAASGMEVVRQVDVGGVRLEPEVEIAAYRVLQEALTNAAKHSGATTIRVAMHIAGGQLHMGIHDNGRGLRREAEKRHDGVGGLGMTGMRERIVLLQGEFDVSSDPASGTSVTASLPTKAQQS